MIVLSLFDGMSCGRIALDRAGIRVKKYYASEVDKYAITVANANYEETVQLGDVSKWQEWDIPWHEVDLIIGGSPCQGFSFAGHQLAFDDPRSALFFKYVEILNYVRERNPKVKFLLENVKMQQQFIKVISGCLGVEPVFINSAEITAHNRQRLYWANWDIEPPVSLDKSLSDILEGGFVDRDKSYCLDAGYARGGNLKRYFLRSSRQLVFQYKNMDMAGYSPISGYEDTFLHCKPHQKEFLNDMGGYRKLSVLECERLQTVPDGYTDYVSNSQRYKMLGNGWTVDVIAHIFRQMLK